ncbi:MAG TPA: acyltransferase [Patescibacteria group bacterium]|nr:acyltransferase [Patescibacteria group bacterium]
MTMQPSNPRRIPALNYLRGLAMLGVIGIHTGAYSLSNPHVNLSLFALLEIVTRFCVPIFFFISAFGLFLNHNLKEDYSYLRFMSRRAQTVLWPYLAWSFMYMVHYTWFYGDRSIWSRDILPNYFFFGFASYQLYFLVILLWFYLLFPLWRRIIQAILNKPVVPLTALLILQILFNYYSSYHFKIRFDSALLNTWLDNRMSYLCLHYVFIFLLGAVCAARYQDFLAVLNRYRQSIGWFFALTLAGMLAAYYHYVTAPGSGPERAVNIVHQLSPIGVLYTLAATLFVFDRFQSPRLPRLARQVFDALGTHSYVIFLVHPFIMHYLTVALGKANLMMTFTATVAFFLITVAASLTAAIILQKILIPLPLLYRLLTGSLPKTRQPLKPAGQ